MVGNTFIISTQELNRGLLHCRKILDQLSYQGSPLRDALKLKQKCCLV